MGEPRVFKKRILLAEDERGVREAIKYLLRVDEHLVIEADNGAEALEQFRREQFDLVITDYIMPQMRGDELAANIKNVAPNQPVLMISAYAEELAGGHARVDGLLRKPFTFQELRSTMARLLGDCTRVSEPRQPPPTGDRTAI